MRLPSDAQAAALALVAEFGASGAALYWPKRGIGEQDDHGSGSRAGLWTEQEDRANSSQFVPAGWSIGWSGRDLPRKVTMNACIRHGWLDVAHERVLARGLRQPGVLGGQSEPVTLRELALTEDGTLALGLWRHRKLTGPPAEEPALAGRDREIVALAEHAQRLGFRLAPRDDQARADARRLAREGWVTRGHLGAGVRTLVPTAVGSVEVNPQAADIAQDR